MYLWFKTLPFTRFTVVKIKTVNTIIEQFFSITDFIECNLLATIDQAGLEEVRWREC